MLHMESCSPGQDLQHPPMYQSRRGRPVKYTDKMESFIDLKRKRKVEKVPNLPVQLDPPELGHELLGKQTLQESLGKQTLQESLEKQILSTPSLKPSKTFQSDGPTVLPHSSPIFHYEDPLKKFGVNWLKEEDDEVNKFQPSRTKPVGSFVKGCVKYTTQEGLKQMLNKIGSLQGDQGCIVDENFLPEADVYNMDCHFIVDRRLGKGSNGKAELCYDTNSRKAFVKKEVLRSNLRASEVLVPLHLDHKNVTKFYGLILRDGASPMVELMMEYAGTALNHLLLDMTLTPGEIWNLTHQGLEALQQLDYFGMIHLDVKPENLCVERTESGLTLKLTDFGSAKLPQEAIAFCGWTPEYMAPESCKLVLQQIHQVQYGVSEAGITGKVDVFAFALVVMYLYKRYHVLQKVVTGGKTSYSMYNQQQRQALQFQLMLWLSSNADLVQNLIPDECDLDMRELLMKMTQYEAKNRLSAEEALTEIKKIEKKRMEAELGVKEEESSPLVPGPVEELLPSLVMEGMSLGPQGTGQHIPDIARHQMEVETGPIKNLTKDRLRRKLQKPYAAGGGKKGGGMGVASKTLAPPPQTPVEEMEQLSLAVNSPAVQRTENTSQVVMQPTDDVNLGFTDRTLGATLTQTATPAIVFRSNLGQLVTNTTQMDMRRNRIDRTTGVPPLACEPETMEVTQCDGGKGRYEAPRKAFVGFGEDGEVLVSVAKTNTVNLSQKELKNKLLMRQLAMMVKSKEVTFGNTHNSVEPASAATEAQGNLPNFAFL